MTQSLWCTPLLILVLSQRLNIVEFYFSQELDDLYNRAGARITSTCQGVRDSGECQARALPRVSRRIATVRIAPESGAAAVGFIHAVLRLHPQYGLGYALEFEPADRRGTRLLWMESAGDWGYGIEQAGVRVRGDWVQLFGPPFPAVSWLDTRIPTFTALVSPLAGTLVKLPALPAALPDGTPHRSAPGTYLVESVRNGVVFFRVEIATDMPCEGDATPPAVMPPTLRVPGAALFSRTGAPLFSLAYGRGC